MQDTILSVPSFVEQHQIYTPRRSRLWISTWTGFPCLGQPGSGVCVKTSRLPKVSHVQVWGLQRVKRTVWVRKHCLATASVFLGMVHQWVGTTHFKKLFWLFSLCGTRMLLSLKFFHTNFDTPNPPLGGSLEKQKMPNFIIYLNK